MERLIIEAAINEQAPKALNPHVPYTPEEIAQQALEAADAGAAIVHLHARDPVTGELQHPGTELYVTAMSLIRQKNKDVILYPTYSSSPTPEERFQNIEALAKHPEIRLDFATIDPGAVNLGQLDEELNWSADRPLSITHREAEYFFSLCNRLGVQYSVCVRELGHVRHAITYYRKGLMKGPILFKVFLSDIHNWGMPPSAEAINTYMHRMMPSDIPYSWMTCIYGPSHAKMNMLSIAMGGHIRTGLGDNPLLDGEQLTNGEQVERVVKLSRDYGREIATPSDVRAYLSGQAAPGGSADG